MDINKLSTSKTMKIRREKLLKSIIYEKKNDAREI